jgi:hypothetical protein
MISQLLNSNGWLVGYVFYAVILAASISLMVIAFLGVKRGHKG